MNELQADQGSNSLTIILFKIDENIVLYCLRVAYLKQ